MFDQVYYFHGIKGTEHDFIALITCDKDGMHYDYFNPGDMLNERDLELLSIAFKIIASGKRHDEEPATGFCAVEHYYME